MRRWGLWCALVVAGCGADAAPSAPGETLEVFPAWTRAAVGVRRPVEVWRRSADGLRVEEVTGQVTLEATGAARVEGGMVSAGALGEGALVARLGAATGTARVEGIAGAVEGLRVRPASVLRGAGQGQRLQAFGRFGGGPEIELTQAVVWEGAPGGALEVSQSGEVVARLGSASVRVPVVVARQALERMTPERERLVLPLGTRLPVEVLGSYGADGVVSVREQASWRSLDEDVVGVVEGVVEGRRAGEAEVVAQLEGQQARVRVEVVERAGQGVAITPGDGVMELGAEGQFSASALFEDGSSAYVTREGVWTSSDPAVLAVGNGERLGGQVTALGLGRSVLTVRFGQAQGELEVEVIPAR